MGHILDKLGGTDTNDKVEEMDDDVVYVNISRHEEFISLEEPKAKRVKLDHCNKSVLEGLPIEILEHVFRKLNVKNLKNARLVCKKWNKEIKEHQSFSLIIQDKLKYEKSPAFYNFGKKSEPARILDFLKTIACPHTLKIEELQKENYDGFLRQEQSKHVERLKVTCVLYNGFFTTILLGFINLKVLNINDIALEQCDFAAEFANNNNNNNGQCKFLWNLEQLVILVARHRPFTGYYPGCACSQQSDGRLRKAYGNHVQLHSKNITFLLQNIASKKIKYLDLEINPTFIEINSCAGRQNYRFEDLELELFISRNKDSLEHLELYVPAPMPSNSTNTPLTSCSSSTAAEDRRNQYTKCLSSLPTSLTYLNIHSTIGNTHSEYHNNYELYSPELFEFDRSFYNDLQNPLNFLFWKQLCLKQRKLERLEITIENNFNMQWLYDILQNNKNTLQNLSLTKLNGPIQIDGQYFQDTKINVLEFEGPIPFGVQNTTIPTSSSLFINLHLLPQTVTNLKLFNIKIRPEDLISLTRLKNLKYLSFVYLNGNLFNFGPIDLYGSTLQKFVHQCKFVHIGLFKNNYSTTIQDTTVKTRLEEFGVELNEIGENDEYLSLNYYKERRY